MIRIELSSLKCIKYCYVMTCLAFLSYLLLAPNENVALDNRNNASTNCANNCDNKRKVKDKVITSVHSNSTCSERKDVRKDVDLRIIILTYGRANALRSLLLSLNELKLDGALALIEIWIDRGKDSNRVRDDVLNVAKQFTWLLGSTNLHVWSHHVGVYGQWVKTWCPSENSTELALILEEDLVVSPHAWRWLKAARDAYGHRNDIAGYTLQSEMLMSSIDGNPLQTNKAYVAFAYRLIGTWGFAPHPRRWAEFQSWFHRVRSENDTFQPYVDGIIMTTWYQDFERREQQDSMWSMWFIYFANERGLYVVYNNIALYSGKLNAFLAVHNAAFGGMHYAPASSSYKKHRAQLFAKKKLLRLWRQDYVSFPSDIVKYEFDGLPATSIANYANSSSPSVQNSHTV